MSGVNGTNAVNHVAEGSLKDSESVSMAIVKDQIEIRSLVMTTHVLVSPCVIKSAEIDVLFYLII